MLRCSRIWMHHLDICAARDHNGKGEEQQPLDREALDSKDTSVLAFGS